MSGSNLIIDANSIGFASHQATKLTVDGREVQAIFGIVKTIHRLLADYRTMTPVVLWDGRSWRKDVFEGYKANRDTNLKIAAMRDRYKEQRPEMARALRLLGVTQMIQFSLEADDIAGVLCHSAGAESRIVLITGDRDWIQLVRPGVAWIDYINRRACTHKTFAEFTGYANPMAFLQGKALQGDVSDNIPGVGGIGEKGAMELLREFGSVGSFLSTFNANPERKWPKKLRDFAESKEKQAIFDRNMRLMSLSPGSGMPAFSPKRIETVLDEDGFREFCLEFAFHSILRDFDTFLSPFRRMKEAA